ncbi:hypothetical protein NXC14_CH02741 [Rhizobium sp. NXC14]|nr:hypothetical protein NXC14_CH02741 [Rhizobium sp. NXC14]
MSPSAGVLGSTSPFNGCILPQSCNDRNWRVDRSAAAFHGPVAVPRGGHRHGADVDGGEAINLTVIWGIRLPSTA